MNYQAVRNRELQLQGALVKQPEIIMADEPTGALDSNTGRQVFETLKNLSKDKPCNSSVT